MAKEPKEIVATFTKERETKNKQRYQEDTEPFAVNKLYLGKEFVKELGNPKKIEVTIKAAG